MKSETMFRKLAVSDISNSRSKSELCIYKKKKSKTENVLNIKGIKSGQILLQKQKLNSYYCQSSRKPKEDMITFRIDIEI